MADTSVLSGLDLTKWRPNFIREFVRDSGFAPYMSTSPNSIINIVNDLKAEGATIRVPLVGRLKSSGVSGNQRLGGQEENLDEYYQDVTWDYFRNAIQVSKKERYRSAVDLMAVRRPLLKEWASEKLKYDIINAFTRVTTAVSYGAATSTQRNTWLAANLDRALFGASISNNSSGVFATALGTVDTTADKLSTDIASLAKRMARLARPMIKPFREGTQGREYYLMLCHPFCFRDLKTSTTMVNANRDARAREGGGMKENPLFQDGDLEYDGIIFREIPEFYQARQGANPNTDTHYAAAGSSCDVGANFLCGAQSLAMVNKQAAMPISKKEDDYGFFSGVGIEMAYGLEKMFWNNNTAGQYTNLKDVGIVSVYCAAQPDT